MNKHTTGPWEFIGDGLFGGTYFDTKGVKRHRYQVFPFFCEDRTQGLHGMRHEADKRLIAAAPELLQALIDIRKAYQEMFDVMPVAWQTFDHIAASAVAKATGKHWSEV